MTQTLYGYGAKKQCCGSGFGRTCFFWLYPDLGPHRDGEYGSGTNPGSIKGSQNKEAFFNILKYE